MDLLSRTSIVLVGPRFAENVGAVARAMAHTGLRRLVIVDAPGIQLQEAARRLAVDAEDILETASQAASFAEAIADARLVFGTTAHEAYETWQLQDPLTALRLAKSSTGEIALVFGCERYGLTKALLRRCDQVVHLPTARPGCSLNLAQAVLALCWEWWRGQAEPGQPETPAGLSAEPILPDLDRDWVPLLEVAGFLKPHNREKKLATLRQILSRIRLSLPEAAALQGLGSKLTLLIGERAKKRE